jgi:hypothetical protein
MNYGATYEPSERSFGVRIRHNPLFDGSLTAFVGALSGESPRV